MRVPRPRRDRRRPPLLLAAAGVAVGGAMVLPVVHLVARASEAADPMGIVTSDRVVGFLVATFLLAGAVMTATVVLGGGIAFLVDRTDLPLRRGLGWLAVLPLVVPTYVGALALDATFGPRGAATQLAWVRGFWGATLALSLSTYPYVLLMTRAALAGLDPAVEEAARALGDRPARVLWRVTVPQLRPALAAGGLLSFLYVLSDFGAVSILQYDTLTRGIYLEFRSLAADRSPAAVLGVVLVALTLAALAVERRARGRTAPSRAVAGTRPARQFSLGRWRWPAAAAVALVIVAGIGVPVGVLLYWVTVGSSQSVGAASLGRAAATSAGLSLAAAVVAVVVAVPVAVLAVRFRSRFSRAVEALSFSGYALPGLVVALSLVFFTVRFLPFVYQTLPLVVVAYVVRFFPEALGSVRSSLTQVDPALEEAARSLGRRRWSTTATVTLPLVRNGLLAGGALVFLTAMKELPATLLLQPAGVDTLAVRVWTGASEGLYAQAAPAALLVVAVSALVLLPMRQSQRR